MACSINGTMNLLVLRSALSLKASVPFLRRTWKRKPMKLLRVSLPQKLTNTSYVVLIAWDEELHWMMVLEATVKAVKVQWKVNGLWIQRNHVTYLMCNWQLVHRSYRETAGRFIIIMTIFSYFFYLILFCHFVFTFASFSIRNNFPTNSSLHPLNIEFVVSLFATNRSST